MAVANDRDNNHQVALELPETTPDRLVVAPTVIAEVCYLLHEHAGAGAEVRVLRAFDAGELDLADLTLADVRRAANLAERYADLGLGSTDASIVDIAQRLQVTWIATLDR